MKSKFVSYINSIKFSIIVSFNQHLASIYKKTIDNTDPSRMNIIYVSFLQLIQDKFFPDQNFKAVIGILERYNKGDFSDSSSGGGDGSSKNGNDQDEGDELEDIFLEKDFSEEEDDEDSEEGSGNVWFRKKIKRHRIILI